MQTPSESTQAEFTIFMRAYQDMVFSTAARLTGRDAQAEDIAQEVFVKAYENFSHLRHSPTVGGWLKTVATNLSLNHLTRHRRRWRLFSDSRPDAPTRARANASDNGDDAPEFDVAVPDTLLEDLTREQRHAAIEAALPRLPDHQRVPLVLHHFEDLSYEQIAVRLGISLAKVKTDIRRARLALLPLLRTAGISP